MRARTRHGLPVLQTGSVMRDADAPIESAAAADASTPQTAKDGTPFAKIENPVAADAELSVGSKEGMNIVNVNAANAKNEQVPGSTPAVVLLQGKTKTNLDKTMDGKKLAAGNYIMSVVSEGKTASILVTIK